MMHVKVERGERLMRKMFAIGLAVLAASAAVALGGERENALSHIAQAFAVTKLCPQAEIVNGPMLILAAAYGVDFERDKQELLLEIADQVSAFKGQAPEVACVAGQALYGPGGANVPGLLQFR
jgi:hypothetical protein